MKIYLINIFYETAKNDLLFLNMVHGTIPERSEICCLPAQAKSANRFFNVKPGIHDASFASKSPFKFLEFKFFDRVYHTRNLNQKT